MSTRFLHTVALAALTVCLAALLAIATAHRERVTGDRAASFALEGGFRFR